MVERKHKFTQFLLSNYRKNTSSMRGCGYKRSKPCITFGLQQGRHDMNMPQVRQVRLTIWNTPNDEQSLDM